MGSQEEIEVYDSLDRLKEFYPGINSVNKILSNYPIALGGEDSFVRDFAGKLAGGSREARQIYRTAADIQEKAALIWANIKDAVDPYYNQVIFNNLPDNFLNKLRSIPAYNRLFGSLDYINCDHCRSIFGPAAYFADLMRFVDTYITKKNAGIPGNCALGYRRPDLARIRLDCSNSTNMVPSIDLVNELMQAFLETTGNYNDAYKEANDAFFPQSLPFNLPLEQIRSYLKKYDTSLYQIYHVFAKPFAVNLFSDKINGQMAREFLELSPNDFNLIKNEITSPEDVSRYYGGIGLNGIDGLENVDVLLEQTKLTREELNGLITQNLDRHEINAGLSRLFLINSTDDGLGPLSISQDEGIGYDKLENLSFSKLDRLYRFLKLSRKLGWSFVDLDWSIRSLHEPYVPEKALKFDGIDDYVYCLNASSLGLLTFQDFTIESWISPDSSGSNAILGMLVSRTVNQLHLLFGVNPSNKLVFCVMKLYEGTNEKAKSEEIFKVESNDSIPQDVFTHVALTGKNGKISLFINGKLDIEKDAAVLSGNPLGGFDLTSIYMNLGRDIFAKYFDGIIKEVRIWKNARSETEIEENRYQRFTGQEHNLVGYWPLTEDRWGYLPDLSPNGMHAVMGNGEFTAQPIWVYRDLILDPLPDREEDRKFFQFNGQDQYLAGRIGFDETSWITIEARIKIEERSGAPRQNDYILCMRDESRTEKLALWCDNQGYLNFWIDPLSTPVKSINTISLGQSVQVCIVLAENQVLIYINGIPENPILFYSTIKLGLINGELSIGQSFDEKYFCGRIEEVRIWSRVRTGEEINSYIFRPIPSSNLDLIGYWRLDEIIEGMAQDLTYHNNHLYLGGLPKDYRPSVVATDTLPLSPSLPVPARGTVLQFDGDNDVIVIKNKENWGLGRYERLTLELWINVSAKGDPGRKQVIFAQGDAEAGLSIYLYNRIIHVLEWNNGYENAAQNILPLNRSLFTKTFPYDGHWHHIALTHNEFPNQIATSADFPLDDCFFKKEDIEFRAFLDGTPMQNAGGNEVCKGYKLSPVGAAYLGGLGKKGRTCFEDAYSDYDHIYFFAGQIANLGIYNFIKSADEIARGRYFAPAITKDLVTYMPMDEGKGWTVNGWEKENCHIGTLQDRNIGLVTDKSDPELINIYSHYSYPAPDESALLWKNYIYSGRMRIAEGNASVGVTFLSRHPKGIDQCYLLGRDADNKTFRLFAHPFGVQKIKSSDAVQDKRDSGIEPQLNIWYHFQIRVEDTGTRTNITAKIWPETAVMPDTPQIDAYDDNSSIRIISGTVGLWTTGTSSTLRQYDNLRLWPNNVIDPTPSELLLDINFEAESQVPEPNNWLDAEDRQMLPVQAGLFKQISVFGGAAGETAFGTDSADINIHSYYNPRDAVVNPLTWNNYIYQGRMRISDKDSCIGVIFLSRQPEGIDQYYGLVRDDLSRTFHLVAHPQNIQNVKSFDLTRDKRDSGIEPQPNVWYRFLIDVLDTGSQTRIRAKIWPESGPISPEYAIDAYDDSSIRIISGTVGVWASGIGSKYYGDLSVCRDFLISENFNSYSVNQDPVNWRDTKEDRSNEEDNSLFKTFSLNGNMVFGTKSQKNLIHSHYIVSNILNWKNYTYTGRMCMGDSASSRFGGIGVTFLSQYLKGQPNNPGYYTLMYNPRENARNGFYVLPGQPGPVTMALKGKSVSNLTPQNNTWYRFLIVVVDTGTVTTIRAKIWQDSGSEPTDYQIDAYDDRINRLKSGTVGVMSMEPGSNYFDDLQVVGTVLLSDRPLLESWHDVTARIYKKGDSVNGLFKAVDLLDNTPHWVVIPNTDNNSQYPVLLHPLSKSALEFDGLHKYISTNDYGTASLNQFTVEAWVSPSELRESSIISFTGKDSSGDDIIVVFGTDGSGNLRLLQNTLGTVSQLAISSGKTLQIEKFCQVAVSLKSSGTNRISFFMDGEMINTVTTLSQTNIFGSIAVRLDIGKGIAGIASQYFHGKIKDVRIWNTARSAEDITFSMYQRAVKSANLIGYWSMGEDDKDVVIDSSVIDPSVIDPSDMGHPMRLGGLKGDRCPALIYPQPLGFWHSQRQVLDFNGSSNTVLLTYDAENAIIQRRTVEVWFWVEDKTISRQKQVIYQEGDNQCGLFIYICDSSLYFGGCNLLDDRWQGTWLHTERIESGRWHHAALVLDGRDEKRDASLHVYLDGKRMDEGPASQLQGPNISLSLGGLRNRIKFHDGDSINTTGHYFRGQILSLRVWKTARTAEQIRNSLYCLPDNAPGLQFRVGANDVHWVLDHITYTWDTDVSENIAVSKEIPVEDKLNLDLWWESDRVDSTTNTINDLSGKGHTASYAEGQIKPIKLPGKYVLPAISLDASTMDLVAEIKRMREQYSQPIDRLTALWYGINHMGKDDQATLFDRIFNPKGTVIERWDYYLDLPMRWGKNGEVDLRRDSQIRSRLMGALRLSHEDLNLIVEYLSGKDENIIELDRDYLTRLFQLSGLAGMLHLGVEDLLWLLEMQGKTSVASLQDILDVCGYAEWMTGTGLSVTDLIFLTHDANGPKGANLTLYSEEDLRSLSKSLFDQSSNFLVASKSFLSDHLSEAQCADIFSFFQSNGIINTIGAVTANYSEDLDLTGLLEYLASLENWMVNFDALKAEFDKIRAGLGNEIVARLQSPSHKFINEYGLVLEKSGGYGKDSLMVIFDGQPPKTSILDLLPRVTEILELRKAIQDQIIDADGPVRTVLRNSMGLVENAIYSELAGLFQVKIEMIAAASGYLQEMQVMDLSHLLIDLKALLESGLVAEELEVSLFKLSKLIYLANAFELTAEEMKALLAYPDHFSVGSCLQPSFQDLDNLHSFKQLQSDFGDTQGQLIHLLGLNLDDKPAIEEALWDLAVWDPRQLRSLVSYFEATSYNRIPALCRLKECFDMAKVMQAGIDLLIQLADKTLLESSEEYDFYTRQAPGLLEVLRAGYTEEKWPDAYKPIHDELAVKCRDALLDLALLKLPRYWQEYIFCWDRVPGDDVDLLKIFLGRDLQQSWVEKADVSKKAGNTIEISIQGGNSAEIVIVDVATENKQGTATLITSDGLSLTLITKLEKDKLDQDKLKLYIYRQNMFRKGPDIYHEYFLLDLQVGSEMETSHIVQATAALQFYIQRCLMNLEAGIDPATIPLQEWEWVKNYRVWEANRKVFLYPENYIEPELRDTKTPFFEDLEQELMQSDISQETVEAAYVHYLEKFAEVANLKIVGSYLHVDLLHVDLEDPAKRWETLYLVGRTNTEPRIFYQRTHVKDENGERWLAWEKIDLVINSDFVTPVYAFGKLFLFWTEFTKLKKGVGNSGETVDVYNTSLKYSYFNFSQEWKPPQSWVELDNELSSKEHQLIRWQRIYAQRIVDLSLPDNTSQPEVEEDALVLQIDEATYLVKTVTSFDMNNLTWEFWAKFINANPGGWSAPKTTTGSETDEKAALVRSCILIDYGSGKFKVEAKNKITKIPGYQERVDASTYVAGKTEVALNEINYGNFIAGSGYEEEARDKAEHVVFENHTEIAEFALAAKNSSDNADQKATLAQTARAAADVAWARYNESGISEAEKQSRLEIFNTLNATALAAEQEAALAWADAKNKANVANNKAVAARDVELAKPKWESTLVIVSIKAWNHTSCDIEVALDNWQHIAITLQKTGTGYDLWANNLEKVELTEQNVLPAGDTIVIGRQEANVRDAFIAQMSEVRLWDHIRDKAIIEAEKNLRKRKETGLFCLPLNVIEAGSRMNPVKSDGFDFIIPAAFNGNVLPRIAKRERLILFYGDKIASLRNNLKDQSFQLSIELRTDQNIYDVCLKAEVYSFDSPKAFLMLTETKGLSLKDYAEGIDEYVRNAPTSLSGNYLVRNLEMKESYLADIGNQHGWYIANLGDEEFLVKMLPSGQGQPVIIPTTEELLKVKYGDIWNQEGEPQVISIYLDLQQISTLVVPSLLQNTLRLGSNPIEAAAISADGTRSGYISSYGKLMTKNLQSPSSPTVLANGSYMTIAVAMTPDCRYAVSVESSQWEYLGSAVFKIWDMENAANNRVLEISDKGGDSIRLLAVTPDLSRAVSISHYGTAILWNLEDDPIPLHGQIRLAEKMAEINIYEPINAVAVTIKNSQVIVVLGMENGILKLWNPLDGNIQDFNARHSGPIRAVAISFDGSKAISASADNTLKFWDIETLLVRRTLVGHTDHVVAVAMTPDGTRALSGSQGGLVKAWNLESGLFLRNLEGHTGSISALAVTSDFTRGVSVSKDGNLNVWDLTGLNAHNIKFSFERLSTFAVHQLSENLFTGGIDGLLSLESQETIERNFWAEYDPNTELVPHEDNDIKTQIDFKGSFRLYYEEIFFHIPFLIANKLNSNQKFEEAQKWYQYIFNPTANDEAAGNGSGKDRYWRYLPFKEDHFQSLKTLLTNPEALAAYREDPFDPHAIAALRMTAYKKSVVMKYIDNLLDWGDSLFMQDSRESINEAVGAYVLAFNLLGPRPKVKTIKRFEEIGTFEDFIKDWEDFVPKWEDFEFLTEVEKSVPGSGGPAVQSPHRNIITDFCVPENAKFIGYWDLVEDRLYKIRHSQNFEGIYRQLALFSPPIDPMDLVAGMASGGSISGALSSLNVAVPHYRYPIVVGLAKEMTGNAISLGSSLLDAIEKRDAEKLANLQNTQERTILNMMTSIKEEEIEEVEKEIEALTVSKTSAESRRDHYKNLISVGNFYGEDLEIVYKFISAGLRGGQALFKMLKGIASIWPYLASGGAGAGGSPVVVASLGPKQYASLFESGGDILECLSEEMDHSGEAAGKTAEYERRDEEWEFEKGQADSEAKEIQVQINKANISLQSANRELAIHQRNIDQNKEIEDFYRSKFSNEALYNWMIGRLSSLYFQSYKVAYDMAKSAEKCLQYDIPSTATYITSTHWDSLRKGLLAGEALLLQLDQMEKSHLAQDSRFIEIEKTISMKKTYPGSLLLLMSKGACEFKLNEGIFDKDYPGHYFRVIKTIELTIVTQRDLAWYPDLEEYKPVNVTLIQLGNKTLLKPDINGVKYLMGQEGLEQPDTGTVRANWRANQQVAVSKVNLRDAGMFYMDFIFDNRYFPFEGTGLVSSWRLEIPLASNPDLVASNILDLDDVLIHIRYTAKSDRGRFKTEVETEVEKLLR